MTRPDAAPTCGHCAHPMRGMGFAAAVNLCHPDTGLDCYRLVTIYKHRVPCFGCTDVATLEHAERRDHPQADLVAAMTGFSRRELERLGGFSPEDTL